MPKNNFNRSNSSPNWQDRSGLDPVDTYRIGASVDGVFLRRLLTLNLRTRNLFSLFAMLIFGVAATGLMLFAFYAIVTTRPVVKLEFVDYLVFTPLYLLFGLVLCIGLALLIEGWSSQMTDYVLA